jgi:katanin p80 WD40 repeat-containing subunit B1
VYAVGKGSALASLVGHTSAVECVSFSGDELGVVAGSASGTIKLWDMDQTKVVRTLTGHRSNCVTVDFHPYGEFFVSGSLDTNIKVWDIRRKGCIQTYKGHTDGVKVVQISPDGRWVVSGGADGAIKLWDLTAGKLMKDFTLHKGAITSLDFHPQEFLLASGSADRTVRFWDLERLELVGTAPPEATGVRCARFSSDGACLMSGTQDMLRFVGWEPPAVYDTVDVGWGRVSDLTTTGDQLVGCSLQGPFVGLWVVNLSQCQPMAGSSKQGGAGSPAPLYTKPVTLPEVAVATSTSTSASTSASSPTRPHPAPIQATAAAAPPHHQHQQHQQHQPSLMLPEPTDSPLSKDLPAISHKKKHLPWENQPPMSKPPQGPSGSAGVGINATRPPHHPPSTPSLSETGHHLSVGVGSDEPQPVDVRAFLPPATVTSEREVLAELTAQHAAVMSLLSGRLENLRLVRSFWQTGDVRGAVDCVQKIADRSCTVDFLRVLKQAPTSITLDVAVALLPEVVDLLDSPYDDYLVTAAEMLGLLCTQLGPGIQAARHAPRPVGVDVAREERLEKGEFCRAQFATARTAVEPMTRQRRVMAVPARVFTKAYDQIFG